MYLAIACKDKDCGEVFRLPYPTQEEKSEGLPQSSKENERQAFWCWLCGTVFRYTTQDCHWEDTQKLAPGQHRVGKAAFRIVFQCDQAHCGSLVPVNTITDDDPSSDELLQRAKHRMKGKAVCERGHEFLIPDEIGVQLFYRIGADDICKLPLKP
jgi:hypothetical protein